MGTAASVPSNTSTPSAQNKPGDGEILGSDKQVNKPADIIPNSPKANNQV